MVLTAEEARSVEVVKHEHAKELLEAREKCSREEHGRRMKELEKLLEIAKAGGVGYIEK